MSTFTSSGCAQLDRRRCPYRSYEGRTNAPEVPGRECGQSGDQSDAGDHGDTLTAANTVVAAQTNVTQVDADCELQEVVADKGYHSAASLDHLQHAAHVRTYILEQRRTLRRQRQGKSAEVKQAYCRNKRNTRGARGRRLQRLRSERVERMFAHLLDTGGGRRTWSRGLDKVRKRYLIENMAFNLGRVMRSPFGAGKPRHLAVLAETSRLL